MPEVGRGLAWAIMLPVSWLAMAMMLAVACAPGEPPENASRAAAETATFEVTAYSLDGKTASGTRVEEGVAAADPNEAKRFGRRHLQVEILHRGNGGE